MELLEKLVKLAPKEWEATLHPSATSFVNLNGILSQIGEDEMILCITNDRASAEFIIFALDWLEERGWCCAISNANDTFGKRLRLWKPEDHRRLHTFDGPDATHVQNVVLAVVAVQEATQDQEGEKDG